MPWIIRCMGSFVEIQDYRFPEKTLTFSDCPYMRVEPGRT